MTPRLWLPIAFLVLSTGLSAQLRYRPTENGPWRPWSFSAIASVRQARGATTADVVAFETRLRNLAAIVKRAPAVAQPVGFAAEVWGSMDSYVPAPGQPPGKAVPLAGSLSFAAFPLVEFMRNGRLTNEDMKGGETELLHFAVNEIGASIYGATRPVEWLDQEVEGFAEPRTATPVAGLTGVGDVLIVKNSSKPLWLPVSVAEALQPVVVTRLAEFNLRRGVYARQSAEFADWQTPAKRAARRADWQQAAASQPNGAEFLASMESADRQIEAARRVELAPGGPAARSVSAAEADLREVQDVLAARTDDAKRGPACYDTRATGLASRFRLKAEAPSGCDSLVRPNWDYFNRSLPRSSPQVLMVDGLTRCLSRESMTSTLRGGCVVNRELVKTVDWDAVRAWLDH